MTSSSSDAAAERSAQASQRTENLRADRTPEFIDTAFRVGNIRTSGTVITKVLPPASRFCADGGQGEKKQRVIEKLGTYLERSLGLSGVA